ncbi:hypothetical protein SBA3_4460010 [Candidatus Sulfopaludibacter sp. SbA3]|nr:hypothetical protein SBA3_4460010 [Candidatus Sulfopaludibacter sp. SbA3]
MVSTTGSTVYVASLENPPAGSGCSYAVFGVSVTSYPSFPKRLQQVIHDDQDGMRNRQQRLPMLDSGRVTRRTELGQSASS